MSQEWTEEIRSQMLSMFFNTNKAEFNRCLEPTMKCKKKAIHAHSVQNAKILENLVSNGHVCTFTRRIDKNTGPIVDYGLVGRNSATTFTGLCGEHDNDIFAPIDNEIIDLENDLHLFLLAYRAVYRELHATLEAAAKIQSAYSKRVELGLDPKEEPSDAGMYAVSRMMIAWGTYRYKSDFDEVYYKQSFDSICHNAYLFDLENPTIAVCALFSIDNEYVDDDSLRIALNILPITKNRTYVILSYRKCDSAYARASLDRVISSEGLHQRYEISRFILNNCENFVMSPTYVDSWPEDKKEIIKNYYIKTILTGDMKYEAPELYLF